MWVFYDNIINIMCIVIVIIIIIIRNMHKKNINGTLNRAYRISYVNPNEWCSCLDARACVCVCAGSWRAIIFINCNHFFFAHPHHYGHKTLTGRTKMRKIISLLIREANYWNSWLVCYQIWRYSLTSNCHYPLQYFRFYFPFTMRFCIHSSKRHTIFSIQSRSWF